jgi:carbamoyl-phosphate synthase small subunit
LQGFDIVGRDLLSIVTRAESGAWPEATEAEWEFNPRAKGTKDKFKVVAYDFGIKSNILRRLTSLGCDVTVVPAKTPAADVLAMEPDGVFLSNGPVRGCSARLVFLLIPRSRHAMSSQGCAMRRIVANSHLHDGMLISAQATSAWQQLGSLQGDPSAAPWAVESAAALLGKKPMFGICMGHQILGQAFGASTFKLPFGHHGGNHPIRDMDTGKVQISAQNHNFAVDPATLPAAVQVSHLNLNDGAHPSLTSSAAMTCGASTCCCL